jgi:hypothetical protein
MKALRSFTLIFLIGFAGVALAAPSHVVIVMMENHAFDEIIGSANAPYLNNVVAANGAVLTNSHAVEHPSQPNYLDLFSGFNQAVVGDALPPNEPFSTPNLGAELLAKGFTFATYSEDLPSVGFNGDSGNYARKHNPEVNWQANDAPANNHLPISANQPFTSFPTTDVGFDTLPTLSIVVPNLQDDMHDGSVAMGDTWLSQHMEAYRLWASTHNSILLVTWDEDDNGVTNQIPTIFTGQNVRPGNYSEMSIERAPGLGVDHYNVLRTIENLYGLGTCNAATDGMRNPIEDLFRAPLLNISTRLAVQTGEQVLIGGFIITGNDPKQVLIRGIGPSLSGVGATLADPTLELHQGNTILATNDNWKIDDQTHQSQEAAIDATTIPPSNDSESAILITLAPGAYTAILAGKNGGTGVGVVEVYDLGQGTSSNLANISTRGFVNTNDDVMIGGLIVGNVGSANVLLRALGPSVPVGGALSDPTLELHDSSGAVIATNDNWKTDDQSGQSQEAAIRATTLQPTNDLESTILVNGLLPGNYTAIVRGKNNVTGVGLVEAYNLP